MILRRALLALVIGNLLTLTSRAAEIEPAVEFRVCGGVSSILTDKNVCYILDLSTMKSRWTVDVCAGINVTSGTIIFGGSAKALFCSTVTIEKAKSREDAIKQAEAAIKAELAKPQRCAEILSALGKVGKVDSAGAFKLKEDPKMARKLKEARDKAAK